MLEGSNGNNTRAAVLFCVAILLSAAVMAWLVRTDLAQPYAPRPPSSTQHRTVRVEVLTGSEVSFLVEAKVGDMWTWFLIDTGFGGTPLLSLPVLSGTQTRERTASAREYASLVAECGRRKTGAVEREEGLRSFVRSQGCATFSGGCTQLLMGIGSEETSTTDTVLTPPLQLVSSPAPNPGHGHLIGLRASAGLPDAEVFSTTHMPSFHILTLDVLRQCSPVLLSPRNGSMTVSLRADEMAAVRPTFLSLTSALRGGSFVCRVTVGKESFSLAVDTGASTYVSLGKEAASRIGRCSSRSVPRHLVQRGIGGERVCSNVVLADVRMGEGRTPVVRVLDCPVALNDSPSGDVDGYVGAALLEHMDLLVTERQLLVRTEGRRPNLTLLDSIFRQGWCGRGEAAVPPRCAKS